MPIASGQYQGTDFQEMLIQGLLLSLSVAMVLVCTFVLWGLRFNYGAEGQTNPRFQDNSRAFTAD